MAGVYYPDTLGQPASATFGFNEIMGYNPILPYVEGSPAAGAPGNANAASGPDSVVAYANVAGTRPALQHPIFYAVLLTVIGMILLGVVAHGNVRAG